MTDKSLSFFYGIINSAFKYGFESIDVIQFDCELGEVRNIKKAIKQVKVIGRGGTSFNEPIRYAFENNYDGLVILTDGYAPRPVLPKGFKTKIMWICEDRHSYDVHHSWMEQYGRVCTMDLP
jgi:predicted metal-dependent peptidase